MPFPAEGQQLLAKRRQCHVNSFSTTTTTTTNATLSHIARIFATARLRNEIFSLVFLKT